MSNQTVKSWSFDSRIPDKTPYGNNQGCYYILYTRGTGNGVTKFWIEIEVLLTLYSFIYYCNC